MKLNFIVLYSIILFLLSCKDDDTKPGSNGCDPNGLLETFTSPDGQEIFIYENGELFISDGSACTFAMQYFDPDFFDNHYVINHSGTFLISDGGELFPAKSNYTENFEDYTSLPELFISSITDTERYWTNFTLQSPATPDESDYIALNKCIIDETCTFIDNRIELADDPANASNQVLKFTCVPPSADMITAKCSITSTLNFYRNGSEVWFEADFFIESGAPFSIIDFENAYFHQSPGPRVVIRDGKLELENKFGSKLNYANNSEISIPQNQWFTLKVHLKYSTDNDGIIELWQDGTPIISTTGINLPTSNSIQNVLETGVTASSEGCVLYLDNMRISETRF
ncbi:heparin lyase I family protein [Fulvivirgaceae bacterium BMA10]|uniref:Heparin lyase I family protein n=1 Tax=Splendidivirga corallicola TaxID=3051826 RepID=A0ABT8KXC3_9BACT|nr:heparin lyase I family protein [Fulvivirgaceae bacterium BMA10]